MRRWNITWPALLVLASAVAVIVVLLILPDVDPPDTAFHLGTAPIVVHARTHMPPALLVISLPAGLFPESERSVVTRDLFLTVHPPQDLILLLDRSLRL